MKATWTAWQLWAWARTCVCACSVTAAVVLATVWVRSYWVADDVFAAVPNQAVGLTAASGRVKARWYSATTEDGAFPPRVEFNSYKLTNGSVPMSPGSWGLRTYRRWGDFQYWKHEVPSQVGREATLPIWALLTVLCVWPALWLRSAAAARRVARRRRSGLCIACGYDLRVNDIRCPECGSLFVAPSNQA